MRRGWVLVALLLSLGVNLGLLGAAWMRRDAIGLRREAPPGELRMPAEPGRRVAERLGLDPDQSERFVAIQRRLIERTVEGRRRIGAIRAGLRDELRADAPDAARIDEALAALAREEAALNRAFADSVLESRQVLDPEQVERYLHFLERFSQARGGPGPGARESPRDGLRERGPARRPRRPAP